jgi:hypothetical protein
MQINPSVTPSRAALWRAKSSLLVWLEETKTKGRLAFRANSLAFSLMARVVFSTHWPKSLMSTRQAFK